MKNWKQIVRGIFPKRRFEWREPAAFRRQVPQPPSKFDKPWHKPALAVLVFMLILAPWLGRRLASEPDQNMISWPWAVTAAVLGPVVMIYIFPWVLTKCPVYVTVFDAWIVRGLGESSTRWRIAKLEGFAVLPAEAFGILYLKSDRGTQLLIGVPKEITLTQLEQFLIARGVKQVATPAIPFNTPAGERSARI